MTEANEVFYMVPFAWDSVVWPGAQAARRVGLRRHDHRIKPVRVSMQGWDFHEFTNPVSLQPRGSVTWKQDGRTQW